MGATLLLSWLALLAFLWVARPERAGAADAVRLLPDTIRLVRRLSSDHSVGHAVRVRLALLLAYLVLPIDIVPDFIPVIGYADDVVVVGAVLRSVVRRAGPQAVRRHWPGTPEALQVLWRVLRLPGESIDPYAPRAGDATSGE